MFKATVTPRPDGMKGLGHRNNNVPLAIQKNKNYFYWYNMI